jgi:hypothetical protein
MKEQIWYNRAEFEELVKRDSMTLRVLDNDYIFSLGGIDKQLNGIRDRGIIFLRTGADWRDLEEFAVYKVNGVWKFSPCSKVIEDLKFAKN